jgi:hypothetical protein
MNILILGKDKKISAIFKCGKIVDKYAIDKADSFLLCIDRFIKKRKMKIESLKKADLKFENTGLLTERVVRSIIAGLNFNTA